MDNSILLMLAVGGFVMVSLYAMWLRFKMWQTHQLFSLAVSLASASGDKAEAGGCFPTILFVILIVIIMLVLSGGPA